MTTNYIEAVDQMFDLFNQAWILNSSVVVGYIPAIRWQGVVYQFEPDTSKYWARVMQKTVDEEQTALKGTLGTRYTTDGLLYVQLFCPTSEVDSMEKGRLLANVAKNAFRGKTTSGKIVFRNVRIDELEPEAAYNRFNIISEYQYDEIA